MPTSVTEVALEEKVVIDLTNLPHDELPCITPAKKAKQPTHYLYWMNVNDDKDDTTMRTEEC